MQAHASGEATVDDVFSTLLVSLTRLVERTRRGVVSTRDFEQVEMLLPVVSGGAAGLQFAALRVRNARRYLGAAETGAACWELSALVNQLRAQCGPSAR